tara:strand:- start:33 stop:194 length:162 start_codon:yes stop_codon:yes gene_type:complete
MDKELDNYVEEIMEKQIYRNGIFTSWIDRVVQAMSDFRASPDSRGMYGIRGGN